MTLREFIKDNNITKVEYFEDIVFNVISSESYYGLDVDTSSIESGTKLLVSDNFTINEFNLVFNNIELNLDTTKILI